MRRSKAPSVLNKAKPAKRLRNFSDTEEENDTSDPEDEQYAWGSLNHNTQLRQNRYENKRIFNVVWRDVSTKKHKTWKGDGTLEINNIFLKAILKDETGKYMGSSTKFNKDDLVPDFHMIIGGKEIEIQNEIPDDQLDDLRKRQVENRNWIEEEWISCEDKNAEKQKPKGGFRFKPILVLNPPKEMLDTRKRLETRQSLNTNWITDEIQKPISYSQINNSQSESNICLSNLIPKLQNSSNARFYGEIICFLKPSELQQVLFQRVLEYSLSSTSDLALNKMQALDIEHVLKDICNHPTLVNNTTATNKLIHFLKPDLPDWTEMGPFDSAKLEFVQYFLTDLKKCKPQICTIFANNLNVLNMLQGLCDFMDIKCLRLSNSSLEDIEPQVVIDFCTSANLSTQVLVVNSVKVLNNFNLFSYCDKLIIFEEVSNNLNMCRLENVKDKTIYNLVTAFSIEELLLLDTYNKDNLENMLYELVNISNMENYCCYLHSKIGCNCFKSTDKSINPNNIFLKNWTHFKTPFDAQLLKISSLENSSENIISMFCKKNH